MFVITVFIVASFSLYLFYRAKAFRTNRPMEKGWVDAKAKMALGSFVLLFGVNQLIIGRSSVSLIVGLLFLFIGGFYGWGGIRAYRYFTPLAVEEAKRL